MRLDEKMGWMSGNHLPSLGFEFGFPVLVSVLVYSFGL